MAVRDTLLPFFDYFLTNHNNGMSDTSVVCIIDNMNKDLFRRIELFLSGSTCWSDEPFWDVKVEYMLSPHSYHFDSNDTTTPEKNTNTNTSNLYRDDNLYIESDQDGTNLLVYFKNDMNSTCLQLVNSFGNANIILSSYKTPNVRLLEGCVPEKCCIKKTKLFKYDSTFHWNYKLILTWEVKKNLTGDFSTFGLPTLSFQFSCQKPKDGVNPSPIYGVESFLQKLCPCLSHLYQVSWPFVQPQKQQEDSRSCSDSSLCTSSSLQPPLHSQQDKKK